MAEDHEWDEFKLLQDKFDKLGDFRFRVKTWSIGIIGGLLFGGIAAKLPFYAYLLLLLPVIAFCLFEQLQTEWQKAFHRRLVELDSSLRRKKLVAIPERAREWGSKRPQSILHAIEIRRNELQLTLVGQIILRANEFFYGMQVVLILCVAFVSAGRNIEPTKIELSAKQPLGLAIAVTQPTELYASKPIIVSTTQPVNLGAVQVQPHGAFQLELASPVRIDSMPSVGIVTTQPVELATTRPLLVEFRNTKPATQSTGGNP